MKNKITGQIFLISITFIINSTYYVIAQKNIDYSIITINITNNTWCFQEDDQCPNITIFLNDSLIFDKYVVLYDTVSCKVLSKGDAIITAQLGEKEKTKVAKIFDIKHGTAYYLKLKFKNKNNQGLIKEISETEITDVLAKQMDNFKFEKTGKLDSNVQQDSIRKGNYTIHAKDLIVKSNGDSIICKIKNEDSLKVYFLIEKNDKELDSYIEKNNIKMIIKDYKTSHTYKQEPNTIKDGAYYFGAGPCHVSIGGDFNGESFFFNLTPLFINNFTYIPKIETGIGYGITLGSFEMVKSSESLGISTKASYIRMNRKAIWDNFEMEAIYSGLILGGGCFLKISDEILWQLIISYSLDNIKIKYSEPREFTFFENEYSWTTITVDAGKREFKNSYWNPIPLNIGTEFNFIIKKSIMFYIGIDYQMKSKYNIKNLSFGDRYYYDKDGTELEWKGGLSSEMLRISAGITFMIFD